MPDGNFDPSMIEFIVSDIGETSTREVLDLFFQDSAERLDGLLSASHTNQAQRHARSLKNAAASFGFARISALAQALEADAPALNATEISARAYDLGEALALARDFY